MPEGQILIVEDDVDAREAMQRYLQLRGYDVASAPDAEKAIRCAIKRPPRVLICDWKLEGLHDGVFVAATIQQRFGSRVIFISAHALSDLRQYAAHIDVSRIFSKPVALDTLAAAVSSELKR